MLRTHLPDVVILDLAMPVFNGFDFLQIVRNDAHLNGSKVIVSSFSAAQSDQQMALGQGLMRLFQNQLIPRNC